MAKFILAMEIEINDSSILKEYGIATKIMRDTRSRISKDFPGVSGSLSVVRKKGDFYYDSTNGSSHLVPDDPNATWIYED